MLLEEMVMHKALGSQKGFILQVEAVEFPDADEVIRKIRKSRGIIEPAPEPVVEVGHEVEPEAVPVEAKASDAEYGWKIHKVGFDEMVI